MQYPFISLLVMFVLRVGEIRSKSTADKYYQISCVSSFWKALSLSSVILVRSSLIQTRIGVVQQNNDLRLGAENERPTEILIYNEDIKVSKQPENCYTEIGKDIKSLTTITTTSMKRIRKEIVSLLEWESFSYQRLIMSFHVVVGILVLCFVIIIPSDDVFDLLIPASMPP